MIMSPFAEQKRENNKNTVSGSRLQGMGQVRLVICHPRSRPPNDHGVKRSWSSVKGDV